MRYALDLMAGQHRTIALIGLAVASVASGIVAASCSSYGDGGDTEVPDGSTSGGPDSNIAQGAFRGQCFPNNTCLEQLVCVQGICLRVTDGGSVVDGSTEDGGACDKQPNNKSCDASSACCSGACIGIGTCVDQCDALGVECALAINSCCIGGYCAPTTPPICKPCRLAGEDVEKVSNSPVPRSCCSFKFDFNTEKCL